MNHRNRRREKYRALDRKFDRPLGGRQPIACGKVCYATKSEAKAGCHRACSAGRFEDRHLMHHYFCVKCDAWHIGHNRPAEGATRWA